MQDQHKVGRKFNVMCGKFKRAVGHGITRWSQTQHQYYGHNIELTIEDDIMNPVLGANKSTDIMRVRIYAMDDFSSSI
jgi:hypothetical protein